MQQDIKTLINKITEEINNTASINKIYLFGSYAYGHPNKNSDLDLCIVANDNDIRKRDLIKSIRKSITKVSPLPVDILVYYKDEFDERAVLDSTIEHKIAFEGVSIYEQ